MGKDQRKGLLDVAREREEEDSTVISDILVDVFAHAMAGHTLAFYMMDGTTQFKFICGTSREGGPCDFKRVVFLRDLPRAMKNHMQFVHQNTKDRTGLRQEDI